jgi:hypothetical protein
MRSSHLPLRRRFGVRFRADRLGWADGVPPLRCAGVLLAAIAVAACIPEAGGPGKARPGDGCAAIGEIVDADDDWGAIFAGTSGCARVDRFAESGVAWTVQTVQSTRRGPLFVVPHDDEQTALDTAGYALARYGGTVVAVDTGGERRNGAIDPNRNFNLGKSRCAGPPTPEFTDAILRTRRAQQPIIALHTNKPGTEGRGGGGDISILSLPGNATPFVSARASGGLASEDAFILIATTEGPDNRGVRSLVEALNARGASVAVETVIPGRSDCSLSNYTALNGITRYFNIEAPEGAGATQRRLLDILFEVTRDI